MLVRQNSDLSKESFKESRKASRSSRKGTNSKAQNKQKLIIIDFQEEYIEQAMISNLELMIQYNHIPYVAHIGNPTLDKFNWQYSLSYYWTASFRTKVDYFQEIISLWCVNCA